MALPQKGELLSGRYLIGELLGQGGMGRVYLAHDEKRDMDVAVKVVSAGADAETAGLKRFEREIATLQRLHHPDILQYLDHGRHEETLYLVVEYLKGRTLADAASEFRGHADKVLLLGARLARAFEAGHKCGVIHRDIKPGNIVLTTSGEPRILDYGLARWVIPDGANPDSYATIENLTQTHVLMGTVPYMSPEQIRTERVDHRSDIFSLAVVLYELAAGRRPYDGGTWGELLSAMEAAAAEPLPEVLRELDTDAGGALDTVLRSALEPGLDKRLQSMEELAEALDACLLRDASIPPDATTAILLPPVRTIVDREAAAMVGRLEELAELGAGLEAAKAGDGSCWFVEAAPGMGKSTLVNELARLAHRERFLCLVAQVPRPGNDAGGQAGAPNPAGDPAGRARPGLLSDSERSVLLRWLEQAARVFPAEPALAQALRAFGLSAAAPERGPDSQDAPDTAPPGEALPAAAAAAGAEEQSAALTLALEALTHRMPVFLLVEDLHEAGAGLPGLLTRLSPALRARRALLLMSARSSETTDAAAGDALEALRFAEGMHQLMLGGLSAGELGQLAEALYPGLVVPHPVALQLEERTGGNPSFARGALSQMEEQGVLVREGGDWALAEGAIDIPYPARALADLDRRTASLEKGSLEILEAAAVLAVAAGSPPEGPEQATDAPSDSAFPPAAPVPADTFEAIAGMPKDAFDGALAPLSAAGRARRGGLLVPVPGGYRFDLPLTATLVYLRIPAARKAALHALAAQQLEPSAKAGAGPALAAALGTHFLEAGLPAEALPYALEAGTLLQQRHCHDQALAWFERARAILERQAEGLDESAREPLHRRLAEVELWLGECLHEVGRQAEALVHLESARSLAAGAVREDLQARSLIYMSRAFMDRGDVLQAQRKAKDAEKLAKRAGLEAERGLALSAQALPLSRSGDVEDAEERWEEAAELLEELGHGVDAAEALFRLGNQKLRLDHYDEAQSCYERAARLIQDANPRLQARILNARGAVLLLTGKPAEALPMFEQAAAIRRRLGARQEEASSLHNIAHCHHAIGNLEAASRIYSQVIVLRRELGASADRAGSQRNHAEVLLDLGKIEEALSEATEALATKRQLEDLGYVPHCLNLVGDIELTLGRAQKAREAFGEIVRDFPAVIQEEFKAVSGLAQAEWLAGSAEGADKRFEELLSRMAICQDSYAELVARERLVGYFAARGASPERLRDMATPSASIAAEDSHPMTRMLEARIRSVPAARAGLVEKARAHLNEALEIGRTLGTVEWNWRTQRDLALLEAGDSPARAAGLRAAAAILHEQAARLRREELKTAYLAHRERAELLKIAPAPIDPGEATTLAG